MQAFQQVAEEHLSAGDGDCETFATVSGQNFCSVADLQAAVKTASDKAAPQLYHFDHVYPSSGEAGTTVLVYARLGSASFGDFHSAVASCCWYCAIHPASLRAEELSGWLGQALHVRLRC